MAETTETVAAPVPAEQLWEPKYNPWLIAVVVAMAAFMEVLDTSIANVALPHIAGKRGREQRRKHLGADFLPGVERHRSSHQRMAGAAVRAKALLPAVHFRCSRSARLFCGAAPSLAALILFRVIQGVGGGGLQPMAQAILADTFPPQKRGLAFALYGITAIMAPTIGPTLGGWITDNYSWRWIFYINLPVGILTLFLVRAWWRIRRISSQLSRRENAPGLHRHFAAGAGRGGAAGHARQGPGRRLVRLAFHRRRWWRSRRFAWFRW